ncbi:MAG TPA: thioredoxin domain-containing protein [Bacillales bacterium]|nr:thioredoxin domain-containing protein [Bacillales bacterium]
MRRMRILMIVTAALLLAAAASFTLLKAMGGNEDSGEPPKAATEDDEKLSFRYKEQPMLGDPDAPVKIVEFGDYRCIVCYRFDQKFFPKLKEQFIDTGKAAFYFVNDPILGKGSVRIALAAESVYHRRPDAFWDYHEAIYANQGPEDEAWATTDFLVQLAAETVPEIDRQTLRRDIEEGTYLQAVKRDAEKAQALGIEGTPTVYVNGRMLTWDETSHYDQLSQIISAAYEKAAN